MHLNEDVACALEGDPALPCHCALYIFIGKLVGDKGAAKPSCNKGTVPSWRVAGFRI